jgi:HSP20 family protein
MSLVRWDPWSELSTLRRSVEEAFENAFRGFGEGETGAVQTWAPRCDVKETDSELIFSADLPGMSLDDISVELHGDTLTIKGERKQEQEEKTDNMHRVERVYGAFYRAFTLGVPVKADEVKASYKDGVLTVSVPKAEDAKPKRIAITAA